MHLDRRPAPQGNEVNSRHTRACGLRERGTRWLHHEGIFSARAFGFIEGMSNRRSLYSTFGEKTPLWISKDATPVCGELLISPESAIRQTQVEFLRSEAQQLSAPGVS